VTFALSLVLGPMLYVGVGLAGLFVLTGVLALAAILVTLYVVPPAPRLAPPERRTAFAQVLLEGDLLRLNLGIFALHAVQMAMFVVVPGWLVERAGLPLVEHWKLYLAVVTLSFVVMLPPLMMAERRGRMRVVFLVSVALLAGSQALFALQPSGLVPMAVLLFVFFTGFNVLEASLPSLVSRLAPVDAKGTALGVYNTTQSLGLFAGGAAGGWVLQRWGAVSVFGLATALLVVWLAVAAGQRRWPSGGSAHGAPAPGESARSGSA